MSSMKFELSRFGKPKHLMESNDIEMASFHSFFSDLLMYWSASISPRSRWRSLSSQKSRGLLSGSPSCLIESVMVASRSIILLCSMAPTLSHSFRTCSTA